MWSSDLGLREEYAGVWRGVMGGGERIPAPDEGMSDIRRRFDVYIMCAYIHESMRHLQHRNKHHIDSTVHKHRLRGNCQTHTHCD